VICAVEIFYMGVYDDGVILGGRGRMEFGNIYPEILLDFDYGGELN